MTHLVEAAAIAAAWVAIALILTPVAAGGLFVVMVTKTWREERKRASALRASIRDRVPARWLSETISGETPLEPESSWSVLRQACVGFATVAAVGLVLTSPFSAVTVKAVGVYSGVLLGATASAIGVVFVFVFALVEATLSGREARSVGTFTEVLHHAGATWTLGLSCLERVMDQRRGAATPGPA